MHNFSFTPFPHLKNSFFFCLFFSPEKEVVHPCEAEVARREADIEKNDNVSHASRPLFHKNSKGICKICQRQNVRCFLFLCVLCFSFGFLEKETNKAEAEGKTDGAAPEASEVVKLFVDRPVHVIADDVGGEDAAVHHRDPDRPRFLVGCVREEAVAANQEDHVGAEERREVFQPQELDIELVEEVDVDDHGEADQEETEVGEHYQKLPSSLIAPGPEK